MQQQLLQGARTFFSWFTGELQTNKNAPFVFSQVTFNSGLLNFSQLLLTLTLA